MRVYVLMLADDRDFTYISRVEGVYATYSAAEDAEAAYHRRNPWSGNGTEIQAYTIRGLKGRRKK